MKLNEKTYGVQGQRLVKNEDIVKIGEGGGSYTASNGIKLVDNDIQADTQVLATLAYANTAASNASRSAVANGSITLDKNHTFLALPGDYNGDYDAWFKDIPVLRTNGFTDEQEFGHPVIEGDQNAGGFNYLDLAGTYIIRNTANNTNQLICTYAANMILAEDTAASKANNLRHYLAYRSGNDNWSVDKVRYQGITEFRYLDDQQQTQVYTTAIRLTRNNQFGSTILDATGIVNQSVDIRITKLKANYNAVVGTPTTEGTYKLNVHVDSNGEVDLVSWVSEV